MEQQHVSRLEKKTTLKPLQAEKLESPLKPPEHHGTMILWVFKGDPYNTQRNLFEILLNQTEIRLYLPFSD